MSAERCKSCHTVLPPFPPDMDTNGELCRHCRTAYDLGAAHMEETKVLPLRTALTRLVLSVEGEDKYNLPCDLLNAKSKLLGMHE